MRDHTPSAVFVLLRLLFWPLLWLGVAVTAQLRDPEIWRAVWMWFMADPIGNTIFILTLYALWRCTVWLARFAYALLQSRRLVALKVILPRSDSKIDQEKRTEKDWKERLAVMEQLFRALYEVKAFHLLDVLHFWIWRFNTMSFEIVLVDGLIRFYVVTWPKLQSVIEKQITSYYQDAEVIVEIATPEIWPSGTKLVGYFMRLKKGLSYPLRFFDQMQDDPMNSIANVLSKVQEGERATIQLTVTPSLSTAWSRKTKNLASMSFKGKKPGWFEGVPGLSVLGWVLQEVGSAFSKDGGTNAPGASHGDSFVRMIQPLEELYKRMGEKAGMSGFVSSLRILASAKTWDRAIDITNNMQVAYNVFKADYGNYFVNRRMIVDLLPLAWNAPLIHFCWRHRLNHFLHAGNLLVERELAGLFHFPDSRYNRTPIIEWIAYKVLPPPPDLPKEGVLLGLNRYRAVAAEVRIMRKDRTRHQYIIGKSGTGKSVLLSFMARQDIQSGDGLCLVDPHGDLIEDVLQYVPKERAKDVAWEIGQLAHALGADDLAFETIVAFGKNSSLPHHRAGLAKLRRGDVVQIDMGVKVGGYCSDCSRVFFTGQPTKEQRYVFKLLVHVVKECTKRARVGATNRSLDTFARERMKTLTIPGSDSGSGSVRTRTPTRARTLDRLFLHSLGHGVGLEIHEGVNLSIKAKRATLKANEVITIEPGVYVEGRWGMRLEDTVIVTRRGGIPLTLCSKVIAHYSCRYPSIRASIRPAPVFPSRTEQPRPGGGRGVPRAVPREGAGRLGATRDDMGSER